MLSDLILKLTDAMYRNGLLVLTSAVLNQSNSYLPLLIHSSARTVRNLLYVHLVGNGHGHTVLSDQNLPCSQALRCYITKFYTEAARVRQSLEVRFLIDNVSELPSSSSPFQLLQHGYDVVLTDLKPLLYESLNEYLKLRFPVGAPFVIQPVADADAVDDTSKSATEEGCRLVVSLFLIAFKKLLAFFSRQFTLASSEL